MFSDLGAFLGMFLGVLISTVLPPLSSYVKKTIWPTAGGIDLKPYLAVFAFCAAAGLITLAVLRVAQPDMQIGFYRALLAGYTWQATVEKIAIK
jgi:hypothetical protein